MTEPFKGGQVPTLFLMMKSDKKTYLKAEQVSLFGNRPVLKNRPWSIFIDYLGIKVYLLLNRTRHASRKLAFQCAPGGSFFALSTFIAIIDAWRNK